MSTEYYVDKVWEEYQALVGKTITISEFKAYTRDGRQDITGQPVTAIIKPSRRSDVVRFMDSGWIDPVYNIELVNPPEDLQGYTGFDCYGASYNPETGQRQDAPFTVVTAAAFPEPGAITPEQVVAAVDDLRDLLATRQSPHSAVQGFLLNYLYANHDDIAACSEEDT